MLILGGSGQTGSYLSENYLSKKYRVFNASRTPGKFTKPNVTHVPFDASSEDNLFELVNEVKPNTIINLLSLSSVFACEENPSLSQRINCDFVFKILEILDHYRNKFETSINFVQASSSEMYSAYEANTVISEDSVLNARTIYGIHKSLAHQATLEFNRSNGTAQSAILFNHESPRRPANFVSQKIVKSLVEIKLGLRNKIELGNIETRRDWGYAKDYAEGIVKLTENPQIESLVFASGEIHSIKEFVRIVSEILEIKNYEDIIEINSELKRKNENDGLIGNSNKALETSQWKPSLTFFELIQLMVNHELLSRGIH